MNSSLICEREQANIMSIGYSAYAFENGNNIPQIPGSNLNYFQSTNDAVDNSKDQTQAAATSTLSIVQVLQRLSHFHSIKVI